jgi:hypothetical protein
MKDKRDKYRHAASWGAESPALVYSKRKFALNLVARRERLRKQIRVVATGLVALSVLSAVLE